MPPIDTASLHSLISGEVVAPGDPGWDQARQAWNLVADQQPAFVVRAGDAGDIAETVRFARANGLRVAVQGTGHGASSLGDLDGTILLRTGRLADVTVDPVARTARVGAGACWGDVVGPATEHGLVALHGSSPTVGVAGYVLGGGLGWLARREGLAANRVVALDVVSADGEARRVDAASEPDLFWALRGGGGAAAIVTALELELVPLREAFAGQILWPIEQAPAIVHAYRAWIATVPDTVTSSLKLVRFPPLPEVPEPIRGGAFVSITLVATVDEAAGTELVAPLRAAAPPVLDALGIVPAAALTAIAGDPPGPLPGIGGGLMLDAFTEEAADAFIALNGPGVDSPLIHLEVRHLGGALATPDPGHGVAGTIHGEVLVYGVGVPVTPEVGEAIGGMLAAAAERFGPWTAGWTPLTFAEQHAGTRTSFPPAIADRLAAVTATYDPDGLLVANKRVD